MLDRAAIGVIGFVCFTEEQKEHILGNFDVFFDFLKQMGDMLGAKVKESRELLKSQSVAELLECILNRVDEGVLLLDQSGRITRCNKAACEILELPTELSDNGSGTRPAGIGFFPPAVFRLVPDDVLHYKGYELEINGRTFRVVGVEHALHFDSCARVFVFHDAQVMHQNAYKLTMQTDRVGLDMFVGESESLTVLKRAIKRFANASDTTLILGESGTGKELVARALHDESFRSREVFVALNCSAVPESLFESELFGYAGGAFTGADPRGRMGKFEQAQGGTLFLDEVGEFPLHLQPKLLRVLEQREVTRIGGLTPVPVNVRVIASTNRDLEKMVAEGMFRHDLFYRLNVLPINVPSLRERGRDVFLLARYFLERYCAELGKNILTVRDDFWQVLAGRRWPGNVRELQNVMKYVANIADSPCTVSTAMLPKRGADAETATITTLHLPTVERQVIRHALAPYGGLKASRQEKEMVAAQLGIGIATLYRKIKEQDDPCPRQRAASAGTEALCQSDSGKQSGREQPTLFRGPWPA
jgi:Transcriptional regulator containing PAS, AAA-type ATPase, and DNA-binding domains